MHYPLHYARDRSLASGLNSLISVGHAWATGLLQYVLAAAMLTAPAALASSSFPANATLAAIPDNTWSQVTGTGPPTGALAYSGMAYDSKHHKLLVFGGGHWDYSGNEIWVFDINTLSWSKAYEPVPESAYTSQYASSQYPGAIMYPDPSAPLSEAQPLTRHTYDTVEFIESQGVLFTRGRYTWGSGQQGYCWGCEDTWTYDLETNKWTYRNLAGAPVDKGDGAAAYDPVADLMVVASHGDTFVYDINTDQWTKRFPSGTPVSSIETVMEYDSKRHVMYLFGGEFPGSNELWQYDPAANAWTKLNPSGQLPPAAGGYGLAYDRIDDVLIAFHGSAGTWVYHPDVSAWTQQSPTTGNPPASGRVHGDLKYDPINNVVFLVSDRGGTWAYRYGTIVRPAPPTGLVVK
jgi:hypothetical protein